MGQLPGAGMARPPGDGRNLRGTAGSPPSGGTGADGQANIVGSPSEFEEHSCSEHLHELMPIYCTGSFMYSGRCA